MFYVGNTDLWSTLLFFKILGRFFWWFVCISLHAVDYGRPRDRIGSELRCHKTYVSRRVQKPQCHSYKVSIIFFFFLVSTNS